MKKTLFIFFVILTSGCLNTVEDVPERSFTEPDIQMDMYPQVWSQYSPLGESYEFKVNCISENCILSEVDRVTVINPSGKVFDLEKDFNIQEYSGEVTKRWVLYGPQENSSLPESGNYLFSYYKNGKTIETQTVNYVQNNVNYPTNVKWERRDNDLYVFWNPPTDLDSSMNYKAIIWNVGDTPQTLISKQIDWEDSETVLENVPFVEGGEYSLNVAVYFNDGYAYSDYIIFDWSEYIEWSFNGEKWIPSKTPPDCGDVIFANPVEYDFVTSILYPGQFRGSDYKPHGGFRFDNSDNNIEVRSPMSGYLVDASRYTSSYDNGKEVQYMIDIVNPCGIRHRFDHLVELSPELTEALKDLPEPKIDDSRTTRTENIFIKEGDVIATEIGFEDNVFVDWGVYDFRQGNEASRNPSFEGKDDSKSQSYYAVCWLDYLDEDSQNLIKSLPGSGSEGKTSDYC